MTVTHIVALKQILMRVWMKPAAIRPEADWKGLVMSNFIGMRIVKIVISAKTEESGATNKENVFIWLFRVKEKLVKYLKMVVGNIRETPGIITKLYLNIVLIMAVKRVGKDFWGPMLFSAKNL